MKRKLASGATMSPGEIERARYVAMIAQLQRRPAEVPSVIPPTNPAYIAKALSYNPLLFLPLTADYVNLGSAGGTATGTNIVFQSGAGKDGRACAYLNETSYIDVYSPELAAAWNGDEYCIGGFGRQTDAALVDGHIHDFPIFYSDTVNNLTFMRSSTGSLSGNRQASGGTASNRTTTPVFNNTFLNVWRHCILKSSVSGDSLRIYFDGVEKQNVTGNTGTWEGTLASNGALFGASSGDSKIHLWLGWIQYVGIWPVLSAAQIADLATMVS